VGRRLIVDTNVLIAIERGHGDVLESLRDADELAITAVSKAELEVGVELASGPLAARRAETVAAMLESVELLDYTAETAHHHAALLAHVRRTGTPRGAHDLIIAAHAAETGRPIFTQDSKARFGDLPGVQTV
jgi:predicted nucleic acid-binding protein